MILFQDGRKSTMNQAQDNSKSRKQQMVFLLALIALLILRIPFAAGLLFFDIQWEWMLAVFDTGTYLLTAFLIWWEFNTLADYHIDTLSILIIILFKPIQTLIIRYQGNDPFHMAFPGLPSLVIWLIAVAFGAIMWWKSSKLPSIKPISISWLFIGTLAGVGTSIALSVLTSFQISSFEHSHGLFANGTLARISSAFVYQIGFAAVMEEPLFRGFLWGYLRKLQWRELWIWLFQAGLFTFSHIYYISRSPISFWIILPVGSLVFGWLAWRSRTIATSIVAHGMMNATEYAFG